MAEYIEREKTIDYLMEIIDRPNHPEWLWTDEICGSLNTIPAADVRPVVRGRDICDTVDGHCEFKCSVCGVELSSVYGGDNDFGLDGGYFNYCPNCGAMMEES